MAVETQVQGCPLLLDQVALVEERSDAQRHCRQGEGSRQLRRRQPRRRHQPRRHLRRRRLLRRPRLLDAARGRGGALPAPLAAAAAAAPAAAGSDDEAGGEVGGREAIAVAVAVAVAAVAVAAAAAAAVAVAAVAAEVQLLPVGVRGDARVGEVGLHPVRQLAEPVVGGQVGLDVVAAHQKGGGGGEVHWVLHNDLKTELPRTSVKLDLQA